MTTVNGKTLTLFGCGYVGTAFAREALEKGMTLQALTRNPQTAEQLRELGVHKVVVAELHTHDWHSELNPNQDYVLNCVSAASRDLAGYQKSYIDGQKSILKWATLGHLGTFAYTSSTGVYSQNNGEWVDENDSLKNQDERAALLLEAEHLISKNKTDLWDRFFILRLAGIYGPHRHYILDKLLSGEGGFNDNGEHFLNLIHRDDICNALWAVFTSENTLKNRIYNLCDDHPTPKKKVAQWLAQQFQLPEPSFCNKGKSETKTIPNRKVSNQRIHKELALELHCSDFREGYKKTIDNIKSKQ